MRSSSKKPTTADPDQRAARPRCNSVGPCPQIASPKPPALNPSRSDRPAPGPRARGLCGMASVGRRGDHRTAAAAAGPDAPRRGPRPQRARYRLRRRRSCPHAVAPRRDRNRHRRVTGNGRSRASESRRFRTASELRSLASGAGLAPGPVQGAIYYPRCRRAARLMAPYDPSLSRLTTFGAAFLALAAVKPPTGKSHSV